MDYENSFISPQNLFGEQFESVVDSLSTNSPFPQAQSNMVPHKAKLKAALIHLDETVFFGQVAYQDLQPTETIEICAGFGLPSITINKIFGIKAACIDSDLEKMVAGQEICKKMGINLTWQQADVFAFLKENNNKLQGKTLLATAAYSSDKTKGKAPGSGEKDIVNFAKENRINLALFPFRTGDIINKGVSNEKKRTKEYEELLKQAGYTVKKHSTEILFRGQGAPDWFFLDILTAKCN